MKSIFLVLTLTFVAMICACQKKDVAAQQQLDQWKMKLDAREQELAETTKALDERKKALDEREKSLAEKEQAAMNARTNPTDVQDQLSDPAQVEAEKENMIQQFSAIIRAQADAEKANRERETQDAQKRPGLQELQNQKPMGPDDLERQRQLKMEAAGISPPPH
jgi:chromosome segregation ATPase